VLGVLVLVYVFNFLDRQVLAILAEDIKADLGLGDSQIGFLYGTAFAVFYAVFGIPLGRLADVWVRRTVISLGLATWSLMTAASGLAGNFAQLAGARIGVGVGEASASPSAYSLLSDWFPPERRATVMAIYSSGLYIGVGLGLYVGGTVVDNWNQAWPDGNAPLGLAGWQAAFMVVGMPGLLMAVWVRTLREPRRGAGDGPAAVRAAAAELAGQEERPGRVLLNELAKVLPPFAVLTLARAGASRAMLAGNAATAAGLAMAAWLLTLWLGDPVQWVALGVGVYASACWVQNLALGDPVTFSTIFRARSLRTAVLGFSLLSFGSYGTGFWVVPWFLRNFDLSAGEAGKTLGLIAAVGGWAGATFGGFAADWWRARKPEGRLYFAVVAALLPLPFVVAMVRTDSLTMAYALYVGAGTANGLWLGAAVSTVQDLVLPRMRAVASAVYLLMLTFIGLAMGPYTVGRLSEASGDLGHAIELCLLANLGAIVLFLLASRGLVADEDKLAAQKAQAAGAA
jgi:MFS family permease